MEVAALCRRALDELSGVLAALDEAQVARAVEAIAGAGRVGLHGVGREGLQVRGFAMRLHHLGLRPFVVGDMAAPPVGPGDLLVVSAGPGAFGTVLALMDAARAAGCAILVVTAQPGGAAARRADYVLTVPAQTMADDQGEAGTSVLPMGSLYEGALFVAFEALVLLLRERLGVSPEAMRARHTNLE